jgi:hypothetical protein
MDQAGVISPPGRVSGYRRAAHSLGMPFMSVTVGSFWRSMPRGLSGEISGRCRILNPSVAANLINDYYDFIKALTSTTGNRDAFGPGLVQQGLLRRADSIAGSTSLQDRHSV